MSKSPPPTTLSNKSNKSSKSIIMGGITGMTAQALTWPIEFLKTTKQLPKYKSQSIVEFAKQIVKKNGFTGLYRGIAPQLISAAPRASVRFTVYEMMKNLFNNSSGELQPWQKFICGLTAGGIEAATVMTPAEIIKVTSINRGFTPIQTIKHIYTNHGLFGFYTGIRETSIRQATTQGISFVVFEAAHKRLSKSENSFIKNSSGLLSGILGGTVAVTINNPLDSIKTYKQSDYGNKSLLSISKDIYKTKGIRGFYNGGLLRTMRVAPLHGITFFMYDWLTNIGNHER